MTICIPRETGVDWTKYNRSDADKLRWILSTCLRQASKSNNPKQAFPLSSRVLKAYCGRGYSRLRDYLCEVGAIEAVTYRNGARYYDGHAMLFRVPAEVLNGPREWVSVSWKFAKRAGNAKRALADEVISELHGGRELLRCLDRVSLDAGGALGYLSLLEGLETPNRLRAREVAVRGWDHYHTNYQKRTGRLYSPLANLPRDLRSFVRVRGVDGPLCAVDAKNCHPFILSALYAVDTGDQEPLQHTSSGTFYEAILTYCPHLTRDHVKREVLVSVYDWRRVPFSDVGKALTQAFPDFWAWICDQRKRAGSRDHLANRISRIEGEWFLQAAVQLHRNTGAWVGTIHDCLVVPVAYRELARMYLEAYPLKRWGVVPTWDRKVWRQH